MTTKHIPMYRKGFAAGLVGLVVLVGSAVSQQAFAQSIDYDTDDDNLIEVDSLAKLNAIRYDLDGDGTASDANYATAFPDPATSMGCPATCEGYELMANLDFDVNGDGEITAADGVLSWGEGADAGNGWQPIGTRSANRFTAEFHGNGHTISHLFINRTDDNTSLFGYVDTGATIRNVGLVGVDVTGEDNVGGLGGLNLGTIRASYATGVVSGEDRIGGLVGTNTGTIDASYATGVVSGDDVIGGLAGQNTGTIDASYATGVVSGDDVIGGLVGTNFVTIFPGTIRASYATGEVNGSSNVGGLAGFNTGGNIQVSYFDTDTSGQMGSEGTSTAVLQSPTAYTGIYANWNVDLDGDSTIDDPWDFGTSAQYPVLQVDFDGDGVKSWEEFGQQQSRPGVLVSPRVLLLREGEMGSYTVVLLTTPTVSVTVTPGLENSAAVSVNINPLTFTSGTWNTARTVMVEAVEDDNNLSEVVELTHMVGSTDSDYMAITPPTVTVSVIDNDVGVVISLEELSLPEGTTRSYTVMLLSTPTESVTVTPGLENSAAVSVNINPLTFTSGTWNTARTVMVEAVEDNNVVGEMVSLTHSLVESSTGNYALVTAPDVTVNVTDNDTPVFVSTGTLSLMEGTTGSYTVVLLGEPTTPSVTVTPVVTAVLGNTAAVSVSGPLTFTDSNWDTRQTVVVEAVDDDNAVDEEVTLTHTVSASPNYGPAPAPVVTVDVTDDDGGIRVRVRVFLEGPLR